jgi:hypothetical protein
VSILRKGANENVSPQIENVAFGLACLALPSFLASCKNPLSDLADALKESSDKVALAVPGEMMRRWIDACHNGTAQEQKKCKEEVAKVFGVKLDAIYQITTSFTFDDSNTTNLRADLFPGATQDIRDAQNFVNRGPLKLDPPVGTALPTAMTEADIKAAVGKAVRSCLTKVEDYAASPGSAQNPRAFITLGAPLTGVPTWGGTSPEDKKRADAFVNRVIDAILALRGEREPGVPKPGVPKPGVPKPGVAKPTITRPYYPLDGLENVFVVIPKKDFEEATQTDQQDFFQVAILVHEIGHPEKTIDFPSTQADNFIRQILRVIRLSPGPRGNSTGRPRR